MKELKGFSIRNRIRSFTFAIQGIKSLIKYEHNARIHLVALCFALGMGWIFKIDNLEWIAIAIVAEVVLLSELINTVIEELADSAHPEWNKKLD